MTERRRFIDYARHGGCSQKLEAPRLMELLAPLASAADGDGWPDAGIAVVEGHAFASSVDVILPLIDDPALFGRIVAVHVLSDLYAVGAKPVFALNILGVPEGGHDEELNGNTDADIQRMLIAASETLAEAGVISVGGHTLRFEVLFFGMAATGVLPADPISNEGARAGDLLVLTKPLGTSVATKTWKTNPASKSQFQDVVDGMLRPNRVASEAMGSLSRCGCTDVTGFGLLGHLHNMLRASGVSATLRMEDLPIYESVRAAITSDHETRIFDSNNAFVAPHVESLSSLERTRRLLLIDAQVSGGLLVSLPADEADGFLRNLAEHGEVGWVVGEVDAGKPGRIALA